MRPLTVALLLAVPALEAETFLVCAGVEAYDDPGISPLQSEHLFPWGDRDDGHLTHGPERMCDMVSTAPVGWHRPNAYGLVDMIGNVAEWCRDTYDGQWYQRMPDRDPVNLSDAPFAVLRGGCWANSPQAMRSARRFFGLRDRPEPDGGFRCAQSP